MNVILNGHASKSFYINARALQSSILGNTLLLIFINEFFDVMSSQKGRYADDVAIYYCLNRKSIGPTK